MPILQRIREALFGPPKKSETETLFEQKERLRLQLDVKLLEAGLSFYDNIVDPREPLYDDADFWLPLAYSEQVPWTVDNYKKGEVLPVYITWYGLKVIRDFCRRLAAFNEFCINAHENRVSYIVGKGFAYKAALKRKPGQAADPLDAVETEGLCERVQEFLDGWCAANNWGEREQEYVHRCDRDGEAFLRFFHTGGGHSEVRFVEPEWVKDVGKGETPGFGVETDPEDTEDVKGYWIIDDPKASTDPNLVPAEEIVHTKLNVSATAKRGLPTMFAVRKNLERADKLLRNMSTLAQVRATFAVIRKHKQASASAVQTFQQGQADIQYNLPITGRTNYMTQRQPGEILDVSANTDYEFPGQDVDAAGFVEVLQAELRAIASRLVMPEYMLTSDASNANYSSTMVAEAPATRNFERLQAKFERAFGGGCYGDGDPERHDRYRKCCGVLWRAVAIAVEWGLLPAEALTLVEIQVEGPSLVARDAGKETQRYQTLNQSRVMSRNTWAAKEGLDYEQEKQQLEEEGPPPGGEGGPPGMGGGGGDDTPPDDDFGDPSDLDDEGGGEGENPFEPTPEAHDVSGEPRDEDGKWTAGGGKAAGGKAGWGDGGGLDAQPEAAHLKALSAVLDALPAVGLSDSHTTRRPDDPEFREERRLQVEKAAGAVIARLAAREGAAAATYSYDQDGQAQTTFWQASGGGADHVLDLTFDPLHEGEGLAYRLDGERSVRVTPEMPPEQVAYLTFRALGRTPPAALRAKYGKPTGGGAAPVGESFDPSEPRDADGKWTKGGGAAKAKGGRVPVKAHAGKIRAALSAGDTAGALRLWRQVRPGQKVAVANALPLADRGRLLAASVAGRGEAPKPAHEVTVAGASEQYASKIHSALSSLPARAQEAVAKHGGGVVVARTVTGAVPRLREQSPSGWAPGKSWDDADGVYDDAGRRAVVAEFYGDGRKTYRGEGVLRHEYGHMLDHALGYASRSEAFRAAHAADLAALPGADREGPLAYYAQEGDRGPEEVFAEAFADLHGGGADYKGRVAASFPRCVAHLKGLLQ